ncbi:MAG: hypothetical protein PUK09_00520 [Bacilli bacterium]|nr:hypothetical protein [Bacilli bacterium]
MKILWSDFLNDYLYGKVMKQVQIKQYKDGDGDVYIISKPLKNDESSKPSREYDDYIEWDNYLECYIGYGKCVGCATQISQDLWMIHAPNNTKKNTNTFKEWLLEELIDEHFDVCAVNTEWYDWGRKIRIIISMSDLSTMHNGIKEIVESCVEQYYGDTVKEYSLLLEL